MKTKTRTAPTDHLGIDSAVAQIEKAFGKGAIMRLGDQPEQEIDVISTGSLPIDHALGIGGLPKGRIAEIYGPESSGKTTFALHAIAAAQRQGGRAAFIDAEHALDPIYAKRLGVDVDNLLISQPDHGEQALEIGDILVKSGAVSIVVIDSVAALVPKAEIEGEMGDTFVGLQARLMSQALRKLSGNISRSNTLVLFTNQIREKIGVMFGSPETTPGGRALRFYSSVRIDIRRIAAIKVADEIIGNRTRVKIVKNKVAPPFRLAETDIIYNEGFSRSSGLIDMGLEHNVITRSGTWYSFGEERIGHGREGTKTFLGENPDVADRIDDEIRSTLGMRPRGDHAAPTAEPEAVTTNGQPAG